MSAALGALTAVMVAAGLSLAPQASGQVLEWAVQGGGTAHDEAFRVAVDGAGNSYVVGRLAGTATFGGTMLTSAGLDDLFVAKLDSSGNYLWAVQGGGTLADIGLGIAVDGAGNSYVTGYFQGTATFGSTMLTSAGSEDVFVAKLDGAGSYLWAVKGGGTLAEGGYRIAVDGAGNSYVTGYFSGTATFGSTMLTSAGLNDVFVAKLDGAGSYLWAVKGGGTLADIGLGIAVDGAGNSYVTGYFSGTATFGSTMLTSAGGFDAFVAKLDASGNYLWAVKGGGAMGGMDSDQGRGIAVDAAGNSYVAGFFGPGTATFGSTMLTSAGLQDVFVAKLDASGTYVWARKGGGTSADRGLGLAVDAAGNSFVTGHFQGTATFGSTMLTSAGNYDAFVTKLDSSGNFLWAAKGGGTGVDYGNGVAVDGSGNSHVTGYFSGTATFGSAMLTSAGSADVFVAKYNGPPICEAVQGGGTLTDQGQAIVVDSAGNSYVTGLFSSTASFGATMLTSAGAIDAFVAKLAASGDYLWAVKGGGSSDDTSIAITVDEAGNSYVTGSFQGTATFGSTTLISAGGNDLFVAKLDSSGNYLWAVQGGGASGDGGSGIGTDEAGNSYVTGSFQGTATLGATMLSSAGSNDVFVAKLGPSGNYLWAVQGGGMSTDHARGIAVDTAGNSHVPGYFQGTATFGSTVLTSAGGNDVFVAALDASGSYLWAVRGGGTSTDDGSAIATDAGGLTYVTGLFAATASFGSTMLTSTGNSDVFVAKLDSLGNYLWAVKGGSTALDQGHGIAVDTAGSSHVTGRFAGTATFGSTMLTSAGSFDVFVAKLDSSGNYLWAMKGGGGGSDHGSFIALGGASNSYVTGYFSGAATFGSTMLTSAGSDDIFVAFCPPCSDFDGDGLCDFGDPDDDNDGVFDGSDRDPFDAYICGDGDGDSCDDCSVAGVVDTANDGLDTDSDGLCDAGDPDDDNDGVTDRADTDPVNAFLCQDGDADGCDDCSVTGGPPNPANDGLDTDSDGLCDAGDPDDDNDGVTDRGDTDPVNAFLCQDGDADGCDDCSVTGGPPDPANDGTDLDTDGLCNAGDPDDDNDGVPDRSDTDPVNAFVCEDSDADGCDDCSITGGPPDPVNDGVDLDGDGLCNAGDPDDDNDGVTDRSDTDPLNAFACQDADADGCDDCSITGGPPDPANDGLDTDSDGLCDAGDPDDDNDGVTDRGDTDPLNAFLCQDNDVDGCDDCSVTGGPPDPANDGLDLDSDGLCDASDPDDDNDGVSDGRDADPADPFVCQDLDEDGCDDCALTGGPPDPLQDGPDTDGDGVCDLGDNCLKLPNADQGDCDEDGLGDVCIASGLSADCNANMVPDECEIPLPCPEDIDGTCVVDVSDLVAVILGWGCTDPPGPCAADVDGNGGVDVGDLVAVVLAWGSCP